MNNAERQGLDIVIPVYDEGANIVPTLRAIAREVTTPNRILICYDHEEDNTLPVINGSRDQFNALTILFVRNHGWRKQYRTLSPLRHHRVKHPRVVVIIGRVYENERGLACRKAGKHSPMQRLSSFLTSRS